MQFLGKSSVEATQTPVLMPAPGSTDLTTNNLLALAKKYWYLVAIGVYFLIKK